MDMTEAINNSIERVNWSGQFVVPRQMYKAGQDTDKPVHKKEIKHEDRYREPRYYRSMTKSIEVKSFEHVYYLAPEP